MHQQASHLLLDPPLPVLAPKERGKFGVKGRKQVGHPVKRRLIHGVVPLCAECSLNPSLQYYRHAGKEIEG